MLSEERWIAVPQRLVGSRSVFGNGRLFPVHTFYFVRVSDTLYRFSVFSLLPGFAHLPHQRKAQTWKPLLRKRSFIYYEVPGRGVHFMIELNLSILRIKHPSYYAVTLKSFNLQCRGLQVSGSLWWGSSRRVRERRSLRFVRVYDRLCRLSAFSLLPGFAHLPH